MITEVLAQIRAPNFTAGIVLFDDVVVETAPIVGRRAINGRMTKKAAFARAQELLEVRDGRRQ
ncbi:hypothetical protein HAP48_0034830 [Bradyrhizobium septentrionale]|uniref:Uncharacterized protein n=1 Tax=Bradyrhizobium septentrionale TaxID=1404411 RepID=A0A973VZL0_9BRAD|nr:hypothetical protein [Bradyrhizobium septentrionale]UGY13711.1 hypothetical protein HAP48_0034830 [Bradyrhizobium septentrionale]